MAARPTRQVSKTSGRESREREPHAAPPPPSRAQPEPPTCHNADRRCADQAVVDGPDAGGAVAAARAAAPPATSIDKAEMKMQVPGH